MFLDHHAKMTPDKPAVVMTGTGDLLTYGDLEAGSNRFARALRRAGLKRGSHVAYLMENDPRVFEVMWGSYRAGCYYTPINTRLTASEAAYILADSGAEAFVASGGVVTVAIQALRQSGAPVALALANGGGADGFSSYEDVVGTEPGHPVQDQSPGSPMIYSSGTTGRPKGVERSLPVGDIADADPWLGKLGAIYEWSQDTRYLCPAPLYHGAGLWYSSAQHRIGATTYVMERFDAEAFLAAIETHRITCTQVVPTMLVRLLKLPEQVKRQYDLSSLTHLIHAAAPCPVPVKQAVIDWLGPIVYEYYASTEGNGYCWIDTEEWLAHPGSVGRPLVGAPHIVGDDGGELEAGESGVLYFESTSEPFRYHNDVDKTDESRNERGWTAVGDIGFLDAEGYLYLTGRKSHMIISGGVNIYPQEAEDVLITHPSVVDVAVIGVPNEEFGEEVRAVVQLGSGVTQSDQLGAELVGYCRERLAHYKCPKSVDFVAELPRGENGKLYKNALRDRYWAGHRGTLV